MRAMILFISLCLCSGLAGLNHRLGDYYRGQVTDASCSSASVTMVVNAILAPPRALTEAEVLKASGSHLWQTAVAAGGPGMGLDELRSVTKDLFKRIGIDGYKVIAVRMDEEDALKKWRMALDEFQSGWGFIIMNFDQAMALGEEGSYGHFSPVGEVDVKKKRLFVLDPDAQYYRPYWIPVSLAVKSMRTVDPDTGGLRGFLWIRQRQD